MNTKNNYDLARKLALRRGTLAAPSATEVPTEVRSNSFVSIPPQPPMKLDHAIGNIIIEWSFRVPPARVRNFVSFLTDNEALIAVSCEKLMKGVRYRGTFLTTDNGRSEFRTYWAYDSHDAELQWEAGLANPESNFVKAMRVLRSYWLDDPQASHRHMTAGALLGPTTLGPFFRFTLDVGEKIAPGVDTLAAARKAGRKQGRKRSSEASRPAVS